MDKKMIPQKGEGRLFIVLPTLEIMLSSCDNSKMRAQVAGMEYSNFRKHCKMQTDLRIDTYTNAPPHSTWMYFFCIFPKE